MLRVPLRPPGRLSRAAACRTLIQASVLAFTLLAAAPPACATIDAVFDSTNYHSGQPSSEVSVNAVFSSGGYAFGTTAAHLIF